MEDEATCQKVTDIINHQFDLEILLRHAEGAIIAKELAKAERMLEDLRHAILSGKLAFLFRLEAINTKSYAVILILDFVNV